MNIDKNLEGCYAVIFYNKLMKKSSIYDELAQRMFDLAQSQPGYINVDSVRDDDDRGITVSYWESLDDIKRWRKNGQHLLAQQYGRSEGYEWYHLVVSKIEYNHSFIINGHGRSV
jgi:heme-degrading monooxygenase HmoA